MPTATTASRISFSGIQKRILLALACAVGMRMLGLFLVLPVFTLYGLEFTPSRFWVGFAFGSYGLAMACAELPLGRLSDRIGRRRVLILGMSVFALGSVLCAIPGWLPGRWAIADLVLGRLVQGAGAITATAFATVADHIPAERRSTAMAVLGIPIGGSFILGILVGPVIAGRFGAAALFWLTAALGLGTVALLARYLPALAARPAAPAPVRKIIRIREVQALDLGGFLMNTFMTSFWFYFPLIVTDQHHLRMAAYYHVLLPMVLVSGATMFAFSTLADRGWGRTLAAAAYLILAASALLLFRPELGGLNPAHLASVLVPGMLFLIGFTGLEPILPSLVSRVAPEGATGATLGSFHTMQYLGSFAGGALAGALSHLDTVYVTVVLTAGSLAGFALMVYGIRPTQLKLPHSQAQPARCE